MKKLFLIGSLSAIAITSGAWLGAADEQSSKENAAKSTNPRPASEKPNEKKLSGTYENKDQKSKTEPSRPVTNRYTDEEEAIRKTAESFQKAYEKGDAKEVASHFSADAEYSDEDGNIFVGVAEIEKDFQKFFTENAGAKIEITIDALRVINPTLAVEDGSTIVRDKDGDVISHCHYMAVHTKQGEQWRASIVRDQAPRIQRNHQEEVSQMSWMEGQWVDENEDSVVTFNAKLTDDDHFLLRDFHVTVNGDDILHGSQRIGWDPLTGRLRAWTFDSQGGHFEGNWHRDSDRWILNSTGVTGAGEVASGTSVFTLINSNTLHWQAINQEIDGIRMPDSEVYTLVRRGPSPELSDEHASAAQPSRSGDDLKQK